MTGGDWSDLVRVVMMTYLAGLSIASVFVYVAWRAFPDMHILLKVAGSICFVWLFMHLFIKGIIALNSMKKPDEAV